MAEKLLIVNADDYGHLAGISQGIREAHLNGIVNSTSVMMNRPDAVNAIVTSKRECPKLGLGVHLVISSGVPVLPINRLTSLVNPEGRFYGINAFSERIDALKISEVEAEWRAQINAFKAVAGCAPDHLDSHHHVSYFTPALFELLLKLAAEEGCAIRVPYGEDDTLFAETREVDLLEHYAPRHAGIFIGSFYDDGATLENLRTIVQQIAEDLQHQTFELMCHPAMVDDELRQTSKYNEVRDRERLLLQSEEIKNLLVMNKIRLVRYSELP